MHSSHIANDNFARISYHAQLRAQQRGIRNRYRDLVFFYGDREIPAGNGCYCLSLSYRQLRWIVQSGRATAQDADRCRRLTVVTDGSVILTNYQQDL
ncbi:MAG: hypothetical protein H0W71_05280 [Sphingomonas sp.]|nr:hypothetical protein [Sphingomonas sp.]